MDGSLTDVPSLQTPGREPTLPGTRAWFVFFVTWMIAWAGVALWGLHRMSLGDDLALRVWLFALTCFYLSLCNTFVPLPTAWAVLLVAAPGYALVQTAWLRVLFIAGTLGAVTAVANLNEYHLLAYLLRFGLGRRIRRSSIYGWAVRWFDRSPFQILLLIAFVPIPVDVVRWLAVLRRYSRVRFAWAYFAGRGLRYLLFAGCSTLLALGPRAIVLIQAGLVAAALLSRLVWWVVRRRSRAGLAGSGGEEMTLAAAEIGHGRPEV
jgi:membrane protein YqaA with SNARE-associated domain